MEVVKEILVLALLLTTVVFYAESNCSPDSPDLPAGCGCPGTQPHILQCTCPTGSAKLTELPPKEQIPDDVTFIIFLNCRFLNIDKVPYTQVESLHIRNSGVMRIADNAFSSLNQLDSLDLSDNELGNLTKNLFAGLSDTLKTLVVTGNNLEMIASDAFDNLPNLEKLELSKNRELQLPPDVFSKNPKLKMIELRQCGFNIIPPAVTKVSTLAELDLDSNSLRSLNDNAFSSMKNLNTLGLDSCAIETISDGAFDYLHQLKVLNLGHNHIKSIHRRYFEAFRDKLQYLYIENNELRTLSEDILDWDEVRDVSLGHNPWICDCAIHWITEKLPSKHNKENVTCSKPDDFAGKSLFSVADQMCQEHSSKSSVALAIAIPIIIVCCVLIGYYVYKIIKNKKKGQRKSVRYSAVYKDTVESTKFRPTSDI